MTTPTWQIVHLADVVPTAWRNGGGVTRELVAWPNPLEWDWRISVAEVASAGPFSRFEGVQRWLAILRGGGVRMAFPGRVIELTAASAPLRFDGTDPVDCELLAGAVQDLNLMVRSDASGSTPRGRMRRVSGATCLRTQATTTVALYNLAADACLELDGVAIAVPPESLAWRTLRADAEIGIRAEQAIWIEIST